MWSDGLHLLQGFTSDKTQLYAAIDPNTARPHFPRVFLTGQNEGRGNTGATAGIFRQLATDLNGIPGRKNLIWFSGGFPLSLAVSEMDGARYSEEIKSTLDLLASNQIAIYPVDVRGVVYGNKHLLMGLPSEGAVVSQREEGGAAPASATTASSASPGISVLSASYNHEDEIAEETGGRAFYSSNDVAGELLNATEASEAYYTLTYSPTNHDYNGRLRKIRVELANRGNALAYRHAYYGTERSEVADTLRRAKVASEQPASSERGTGDLLSANMEYGAPMAHQIIFAVQLHAAGVPAKADAQQMAELATQPAFLRSGHRALAAMPLQRYVLSYRIFGRQFKDASGGLNLELAAAAFDADGRRMSSSVNVSNNVTNGTDGTGARAAANEPARVYRVDEELEVPVGAAALRFAVRDAATDRIGAMEIKLPLAPEAESASTVQ